jgi:RNA polymerase sigma-70 factor, ECF subfamily
VSNKTGNSLSDKHLVERVLKGDTPAFGMIIKNTEGLVAQIVFKMIGNAEDRKDIAQDIYMKVFYHLPDFQFISKLSTWIGQIAYNRCLNYLEKKRLILPGDLQEAYGPDANSAYGTEADPAEHPDSRVMYGSVHSPGHLMSNKERKAILRSAIDKLSPIYKTLITLYHQEEMSYEEIGQITGMPEGTVKSYLFRARKALKDTLLLTYKKEEL